MVTLYNNTTFVTVNYGKEGMGMLIAQGVTWKQLHRFLQTYIFKTVDVTFAMDEDNQVVAHPTSFPISKLALLNSLP